MSDQNLGSLTRAGGGLGASAPTSLSSPGENNGATPNLPPRRPPNMSTRRHTRVVPWVTLLGGRCVEEKRQRGAVFRATQSLLNGDTTDGCEFDILLLFSASFSRHVSASHVPRDYFGTPRDLADAVMQAARTERRYTPSYQMRATQREGRLNLRPSPPDATCTASPDRGASLDALSLRSG